MEVARRADNVIGLRQDFVIEESRTGQGVIGFDAEQDIDTDLIGNFIHLFTQSVENVDALVSVKAAPRHGLWCDMIGKSDSGNILLLRTSQ